MKLKWSGKNSTTAIAVLFSVMGCFLSGCDDSPKQPGEGFYWYDGYRDLWRFPLQFPFQVIIREKFDFGCIEKYDPAKDIARPSVSSSSVVDDITAISPAKEYAAFRRENDCGVFVYSTEKAIYFDTEAKLAEYVKQSFPNESALRFQSLQQCYDATWKKIKQSRL